MKPEYREEMIAAIILKTGWNESVFENKSDKQIMEWYDRYVNQFD